MVLPKTQLTFCQCEQPWYIWRYIFISLIWKLHPNGSGEIGAHFSAHYELSQLSSSSSFNFMLWPFGVSCSGMVLKVSNVKFVLWKYMLLSISNALILSQHLKHSKKVRCLLSGKRHFDLGRCSIDRFGPKDHSRSFELPQWNLLTLVDRPQVTL